MKIRIPCDLGVCVNPCENFAINSVKQKMSGKTQKMMLESVLGPWLINGTRVSLILTDKTKKKAFIQLCLGLE